MPFKLLADDQIPDDLRPWVATSKHKPTEVVAPCYIDFRAIEDLAFYHPGFSGTVSQTFKHVAVADEETGKACVIADSISHNWHAKMAEVVSKLRFVPTLIDDVPALIDDEIGKVKTPVMHGWKVSKWTVVNSRDSSLDPVHQDLIEWHKSGVAPVFSVFSWRPYLPMSDDAPMPVAAPQVLLPNALRGQRLLVL